MGYYTQGRVVRIPPSPPHKGDVAQLVEHLYKTPIPTPCSPFTSNSNDAVTHKCIVESRSIRPSGYLKCLICRRIVGFRGKFY